MGRGQRLHNFRNRKAAESKLQAPFLFNHSLSGGAIQLLRLRRAGTTHFLAYHTELLRSGPDTRGYWYSRFGCTSKKAVETLSIVVKSDEPFVSPTVPDSQAVIA